LIASFISGQEQSIVLSSDHQMMVITGLKCSHRTLQSTVRTMCINDTTIFASTDESSYRSTDYGNTWELLSGVYSPLAYFATNGIVYVGCFNPGVYRSMDNGISWTQVNTGLNSRYYRIVKRDRKFCVCRNIQRWSF